MPTNEGMSEALTGFRYQYVGTTAWAVKASPMQLGVRKWIGMQGHGALYVLASTRRSD